MLNKKRIAGAILTVSMLAGGGTVGSETVSAASADQAESWEQISSQEGYGEYEEKMRHSRLPSEGRYYNALRKWMSSGDKNAFASLNQAGKKYISNLRSYLGESGFKIYCLERKNIINGYEKKPFQPQKEERLYRASKNLLFWAEETNAGRNK